MFTQCPECETTYRIGSDDLSGAHGEVECGSCGTRFDALARLSERLPFVIGPSSTGAASLVGQDSGDEQHNHQDETPGEDDWTVGSDNDEEPESVADEDTGNEPPGEENAANASEEHVDFEEQASSDDNSDDDNVTEEETRDDPDEHIDRNTAGEKDGDTSDERLDHEFADEEEIGLASGENIDRDMDEREDPAVEIVDPRDSGEIEGDKAQEEIDGIDPSETIDLGEYDWQHTTVIQPQKPPPMEVHIEDVDDAGNSHDAPVPEDIPNYLTEKQMETAVEDYPVPSELTPSTSATRGGWLRWVILGALIVFLFVWVHQARGILARNSILGPPLSGFYSAIGVDLSPTWDIALFSIQSSTASEDRGGNLIVTVAFTNIADFPQPYPTLKVVLEDRWGESLDTRYFEPRDYLSGFVAGRTMRGGESATGETRIPSAGANAVGFNVDVCLNPETGEIQCASDL